MKKVHTGRKVKPKVNNKLEVKPGMEGWHYVVLDATEQGFGHMNLGYFKFHRHAEMFAKLFDKTTVHTVPGIPQELLDLPAKMRKFNKQQAKKTKTQIVKDLIEQPIKLGITPTTIRVHDEVYIEDGEWEEE